MTMFSIIRRLILAFLMSAALSACVTPNALLVKDARPSDTNGYLSGMFSGQGVPMGRGVSSGFVFVNKSTQKEYVLPFFAGSMRQRYHEEAIRIIEVPPGSYELTSWIRYDDWTGEVASRIAISSDNSSNIFVVDKSMLTFVGRYVTSEYESGIKYFYESNQKPVKIDEVRRQLAEQFPEFKNKLKE